MICLSLLEIPLKAVVSNKRGVNELGMTSVLTWALCCRVGSCLGGLVGAESGPMSMEKPGGGDSFNQQPPLPNLARRFPIDDSGKFWC